MPFLEERRSHTQTWLEETRLLKKLLGRLWYDEAGQDLTEYAMLVVLIVLAIIATSKRLGSALSNVFSNAAASLSTT